MLQNFAFKRFQAFDIFRMLVLLHKRRDVLSLRYGSPFEAFITFQDSRTVEGFKRSLRDFTSGEAKGVRTIFKTIEIRLRVRFKRNHHSPTLATVPIEPLIATFDYSTLLWNFQVKSYVRKGRGSEKSYVSLHVGERESR